MSLKTRRILYITFILAFLTITPVIFLYAAGYSLKAGFKLQKNGMLVAVTSPKNAKIYLNGKPQKLLLNRFFFATKSQILTPAKIKNLAPGQYEVGFELYGYWPWRKKLAIYPGETTYIENVRLFKKSIPTLIQPAKNGMAFYSPDKKTIITVDSDFITLLDFKGVEIKNFPQATASPILVNSKIEALWSPSARSILIGRYVFSLNDFARPFDLAAHIGKGAVNLKWSEQSDNIIYYILENNLHEFNILEKTDKIAVSQCFCLDYLPKNKIINLAISQDAPIKPLAATNTPIGVIAMPNSVYSFLNLPDGLLNLYDETNRALYAIDPFSRLDMIKNTINNLTIARQIKSGLLYANDFEIWLFDQKTGRQKLLTRISEKIISIDWHPSDNYVIYATEKNINVLELDDREKYNITKLLEFEFIDNVEIDQNGTAVLFYGRVGNQEGLYRLAL